MDSIDIVLQAMFSCVALILGLWFPRSLIVDSDDKVSIMFIVLKILLILSGLGGIVKILLVVIGA